MTLPQSGWEKDLLALATQGLQTNEPLPEVRASESSLERAFNHCNEITRGHSRTFYFASALLPRAKRRAVRALYGFCRTTDDAVDESTDSSLPRLEVWRRRVLSLEPPDDDLVLLAWAKTRQVYGIPGIYAHQLIDGVGLDLRKTRYATFDELAEYCYRVASTVGLMSMYIIGYAGEGALPYAVKMGVALQLTNILRDVGEDWRRGRVYLPQDELAKHGLSDANIGEGRVDDRWRTFVRFQIDRTRRLYDEAWLGIALLDREGQFAVACAADLYRAILTDIESRDYDNFHQRAYIPLTGKFLRLPGIWWRLKRLRRSSQAHRL